MPKAGRKKDDFLRSLVIFEHQPDACAKYNISSTKTVAVLLVMGVDGDGSSCSNLGIKGIVAYLDQRWAGMRAVSAN